MNFVDDADLISLLLIARFHRIAADPDTMRSAAGILRGATEVGDLVSASRAWGPGARIVPLRPARLVHTPLPALEFVKYA